MGRAIAVITERVGPQRRWDCGERNTRRYAGQRGDVEGAGEEEDYHVDILAERT